MNNKFCSRFYESRLSPNLKSKIENLKWLGLSVIACVFVVAAGVAEAQQQPGKVPRIGIVSGTGNPNEPGSSIKIFRQALQELGYFEGKNILFEYRYTEGNPDRIPGFLAELLQLKVDVLVATSPTAIRAAKQATTTIPIVMVASFDPVETGIIESLARPGGNITGLTRLTRELSGKRLELFKEAVPGISRVGVLAARGFTGLKDYEPAARALKIPLQCLEVEGPNPDLEGAFQAATKGRVNALITAGSRQINRYRKQIVELAIKSRLPSMFEVSVWVESGGLVSYSADDVASFRRAAVYVDKILSGAKPADLPVEQPTKFEFVINLKTAKQIGVTIPPNVLARADRVIR
jgi:putative tryptophan/tyrosine transport system substrate-binding protein